MLRLFVSRATAVLILLMWSAASQAVDLADLGEQPIGDIPAFVTPGDGALTEAATGLRQAIAPLDRLLARSPSGDDWREYLDWPLLTRQAASGKTLDVRDLLQLYRQFNASENGLEMHQFVRVRRALAAALDEPGRRPSPALCPALRPRSTRRSPAYRCAVDDRGATEKIALDCFTGEEQTRLPEGNVAFGGVGLGRSINAGKLGG